MRIVIFGTGSLAQKVSSTIKNTIEIVAFADNNASRWGEKLNGVAIINPAELLGLDYDYVLICSIFTKEIMESLIIKGIIRNKIIPYYNNLYRKEDRIREVAVLNKIIQSGNKKIALVTRGNSGCNCRALFENIPEKIGKNFDVSLVNLEEYQNKWSDFEVAFTTSLEGKYFKNRINIETFHGFPIKTLGFLEKNSIDDLGSINEGTDYIISYSSIYSFIISSVFNIDIKKFLVTGMPRNDFLKTKNSDRLLQKILSVDTNKKKIIFYVPTYRRRKDKQRRDGIDILNCCDDFRMIDNYCITNNILFIIKKHPAEGDRIFNADFKNIIFLTDENLSENNIDFYQILGASDMLITDFSSIYFDYLLLDKPILFWTKDQEDYAANRGFLFENLNYLMPGPNARNIGQLLEYIKNFNNEPNWYGEKRENMKNLIHIYKDFNSCQRVWKMFLEHYDVSNLN